jgi:hypothetical protein
MDGQRVACVCYYNGVVVLDHEGVVVGRIPIKQGLRVEFRVRHSHLVVSTAKYAHVFDVGSLSLVGRVRTCLFAESSDETKSLRVREVQGRPVAFELLGAKPAARVSVDTFAVCQAGIVGEAVGLVLPGQVPAIWTRERGVVLLSELVGAFSCVNCYAWDDRVGFLGVNRGQLVVYQLDEMGDVRLRHVVRDKWPYQIAPSAGPFLGSLHWYVDGIGVVEATGGS